MSAKRRRVKRLLPATDTRVARALELLALASAAEDGIVDAAAARAHLGCTDAELDTSIALIATLADRESGARAIIFRDHDDIVLEGDAAQLMPLRLQPSEGAVLSYVLDDLDLPDPTRTRIEHALVPRAFSEERARSFASTTARGPWFAVLDAACHEGTRCRIAYRGQQDATPRERLVDPIWLEATDDAIYLVGRDVAQDATRRYRLDRIAAVTPTEEPVDRTAVSALSIPDLAESLAAEELVATIELAPGAPIPTWAGICRPPHGTGVGAASGSTATTGTSSSPRRIGVRVSAPDWLFDQILSAAGSMRIVAPAKLVGAFIAYAERLTSAS